MQRRRNRVAEGVNDKDVQTEPGGADGRMDDVDQDRVGRSGVEEEEKLGDKDERPGRRGKALPGTTAAGNAGDHGCPRDQEVGAGPARAAGVAGKAPSQRAQDAGHGGQQAEEGHGLDAGASRPPCAFSGNRGIQKPKAPTANVMAVIPKVQST